MILNSSGTTGCDQILKQMMYGGRKLEKRKSSGEGEREEKRKRKKKYGGAGALHINHFKIFYYFVHNLSIFKS